MVHSMDTYVEKGKKDVEDQLKGAVDDVQRIGDEYEEVKTGLSDMPGGLDEDLLAMIEDAKDQGKTEADADIEGLKASIVSDTKSNADSIKSDVAQKISDNAQAQGKLGGISSKFGKSAIDRASAAIDQNTKMGDDLMKALDEAMSEADQAIQGIKDKL